MLIFQAKLDLSCLDGFSDDIDFCCRLAKEESVIVLPGEVLYYVETLLLLYQFDKVQRINRRLCYQEKYIC